MVKSTTHYIVRENNHYSALNATRGGVIFAFYSMMCSPMNATLMTISSPRHILNDQPRAILSLSVGGRNTRL